MRENEPINFNFEKRVGGAVLKTAPKVSIITPAYNVARFVAETLDSIFAQTFQDYEIILINDGSPDTPEFERVLEPYFERIVYLKQPNEGAGTARDVAIGHSRGEFLAFLDADDIWLPNFLAEQIDYLEKNELDMVYADALLFGGSVYDGKTFMETAPSSGKVTFESLLDLTCNVITSGTVARKNRVVTVGMFEPARVRAHDYVLWLKMANDNARIGYQRKVLLKYRVHRESLSGDSVQRVEREIDVYGRIKKLFDLTEKQKTIVVEQLQRLDADLEIERGKSFLLAGKFDQAAAAFAKANEYQKSNRLRVIVNLARFAPRLLLKIYKRQRAGEISFVPDAEKSA